MRCFDRVVLTSHGPTVTRFGFPTRFAPGHIHQLFVVTTGSSTRLVAQKTDGSKTLLANRRTDTAGERDLRTVYDQGQQLIADRFGPMTAAAIQAAGIPEPHAPRRCVRPSCTVYRAETTADQCPSRGDRTQRVNE